MLLYNLLLLFVVRDRRFLTYVCFLTSLAVALSANMGFGSQYFWGDWTWWNSRSTNVGFAACAFFSVTLTRHFLSTRRRAPAANQALLLVAWLAGAAIVASLLLPNYVGTGLTLASIVGVSSLTGGVSVLAVIRRWPGAGYFCAAWLALHVGSVMALGSFFRVLPHTLIAPEAVALGSTLEMILLSLALADRINEERRQKEAVARENVLFKEGLEQRVAQQTRELRETQQELVATARRVGMAEVANNVLHNVGNVLNSVNVSAVVLTGKIHTSRAHGLARAVDLMNEHAHDLGEFITLDKRGKVLPEYLNQLVAVMGRERDEVIAELDRLVRNVSHIKAVVANQQSHAGTSGMLDLEQVDQLLEEAWHINAAGVSCANVTLVRQFADVPPLPLDKFKLMQILVNLIGNAMQAVSGMPPDVRRITLISEIVRGSERGARLRITVRDEGEGIAPENLGRIFSHGFTTRTDGHGFGLHSSAMAAVEMGGTLAVHSDGAGCGAVFTLELPAMVDLGTEVRTS